MSAITVLVAAYNAVLTLPRCLDSLCQQTLRDIQIICVDDCSTDGTLSMLQERAAADARILVLQTPVNSGHAVARNLALEHAVSPYVCMVDADDWLSSDALQSAWDVFAAHPKTDTVAFHLRYAYPNGEEREHELPEALAHGGMFTGSEAFELSLDGWQLHGLYVTRTFINKAYPYDATCRLYSDENTTFAHYLHSRELRSCAGIYYYRRHETSQTQHFTLHSFDLMEANLNLLFMLRKEGVRPAVLQRFEGLRWYNFIGCYRIYLIHLDALSADDIASLKQRFHTALHTFRPSRLPLRYRWKPGYWLTLNVTLFGWQQRLYVSCWERGVKRLFKSGAEARQSY